MMVLIHSLNKDRSLVKPTNRAGIKKPIPNPKSILSSIFHFFLSTSKGINTIKCGLNNNTTAKSNPADLSLFPRASQSTIRRANNNNKLIFPRCISLNRCPPAIMTVMKRIKMLCCDLPPGRTSQIRFEAIMVKLMNAVHVR